MVIVHRTTLSWSPFDCQLFVQINRESEHMYVVVLDIFVALGVGQITSRAAADYRRIWRGDYA